MNKIRLNLFQLYCMLIILTLPLGVLTVPKLLIQSLGNNAWLAALTTIIPGILTIYIYFFIIRKSQQPFPLLLEEHLGLIAGKALGILYIFFFLLLSSRSLRTFIDFIETNVLPGTPISVLVGLMLILSLAAIKSGLNNFARVMEIIVCIGYPFTLLVITLAVEHSPDFYNLQPFGYMSYASFAQGLYYSFLGVLNILPVLTLSYYANKPEHHFRTMFAVLISYVFLIMLVTMAITVVLGGNTAKFFTFPTFNMVRLITLGEFIQNVDIIFIGIWILGIFGVVTIWWFMACYTIQAVFKLSDHRFLPAPTALIVGVGSIALSANIIELEIINRDILPLFNCFFLFIIPLLLFIITRFKSPVKSELETGKTGKITETRL